MLQSSACLAALLVGALTKSQLKSHLKGAWRICYRSNLQSLSKALGKLLFLPLFSFLNLSLAQYWAKNLMFVGEIVLLCPNKTRSNLTTSSDCPYLVSAAQLMQMSKSPSESKNAFSTLTIQKSGKEVRKRNSKYYAFDKFQGAIKLLPD